jgi:hypothetical protein
MNTYVERQYLITSRLGLIILLCFCMVFAAIGYFVVRRNGVGEDAIICASLLVFTVLLCSSFNLRTQINGQGISYRLFPIQLRMVQHSWQDIQSITLRTYKPLAEFGGWGYRSDTKNNPAITISGNKGIQLVLTNGKKILIGTRQLERIKAILQDIPSAPTS